LFSLFLSFSMGFFTFTFLTFGLCDMLHLLIISFYF
jgi:hypothetical protein